MRSAPWYGTGAAYGRGNPGKRAEGHETRHEGPRETTPRASQQDPTSRRRGPDEG